MTADAATPFDGHVDCETARARLAGWALGWRTTGLASLQLVGYAAFLFFQLGSASALGATGYGALAHALALGSFIALVGVFGSDRLLVRELAQRPFGLARAGLARAALAQRLMLAVPTAVIIGAAIERTSPGAGLAWPVAAFQLIQALDLMSVFDSGRAAWLHVAGFAARNVLLLVTFTAAAALGDLSPAAVAWLMVAAGAAFWAFQASVAVRRGWLAAGGADWALIARLLRLSWPLAIASAAVQLYQQLPILVLGWVDTGAATGRYAIASQLVFALLGIIGLAYRLILPELAVLARESRAEAWRRTWNVSAAMLLGATLVALGAWAVGPIVITWAKPEYASALEAFRLLLLAVPVVACGSVFGNAFLALGEVRSFVVPILCGAAASLVASLVLIPARGAAGAACALVLAQVVVVSASAVAFARSRPSRRRRAARAAVERSPVAAEPAPALGDCRIVELDASDPNHRRHLARYAFAARRLGAGVVVDAACGTGYGGRVLARAGAARRVVGVDLSRIAVEHARRRAGDADTQHHLTADVGALPLADRSVDALVSFETIEHVECPESFLHEVTRVLKDAGACVVSTPNRRFSSPWRAHGPPRNPFHATEWFPDDFYALLERHFEQVERLGQVPVNEPRTHEVRCLARGWLDARFARPIHRAIAHPGLHRALRRAYRRIVGGDPAVVGPVASRASSTSRAAGVATCDEFAVEPVPAGAEPLVMVAVCRHPRRGPAPHGVES
ncbi:MAG: methyltransferase domain-containing protein [bacterium]